MKELELNDEIVIEWPAEEPLPKPGDEMNAGVFGLGVVVATQSRFDPGFTKLRYRRVRIKLYMPIG